MTKIRIFVSALEYSANIHLYYLLNALQKREVDFEICGIFDAKVLKIESTFSPNEFRVMGFVGVLGLIPKFFRIKKSLVALAKECDFALFMDSSSFNIPLLKSLHQAKNKPHLVYYILPQVWAWKPYRAKILSVFCDSLWGILPFEGHYYPKTSNFSYVGHPLLDEIPFSYTKVNSSNLIAFMPGSRISEIKALFPIFKKLIKHLKKINKKGLLIVPKHFKNRNLLEIYGDLEDFEISFETYEGLGRCEFAFVCSGTATLESTLLGIPTILVYKARWLDYWIAKRLVKLNYIGLANIFLEFLAYGLPKNNNNPQNFPIHPEFLQDQVKVEALLKAFYEFDNEKFFAQKKKLMEYLKNGSAENCARKIENFVKNLQN